MNKALVLAARALVGCATVHQTYAPDGRRAYALNCSGLARGWDKCMDAAGGSAGYDVLDRSDEPTSAASFGVRRNSGSGFAASTNERSMLVACRAEVPSP
jgi:hypothetical protein